MKAVYLKKIDLIYEFIKFKNQLRRFLSLIVLDRQRKE